jgi:tetratricopeptide (TPR) repeat protein
MALLEDEGEFTVAAELYAQCLALDPSDGVAAFNPANWLRAESQVDEASRSYLRAIKLDPTSWSLMLTPSSTWPASSSNQAT